MPSPCGLLDAVMYCALVPFHVSNGKLLTRFASGFLDNRRFGILVVCKYARSSDIAPRSLLPPCQVLMRTPMLLTDFIHHNTRRR